MRSPIVTRNVLSATAGKLSTRRAASARSMLPESKGESDRETCVTSRVILGGLPNSASNSISTGALSNAGSSTRNRCCTVVLPITAKGQRSRSQILRKRSIASAAIAST